MRITKPLIAILLSSFLLSGCTHVAANNDPATRVSTIEQKHSAADHYIAQWIKDNDFNGVIAVGENDAVTHIQAHGLADDNSGRKLSNDTAFQTGSVDKFFASIAVFALIDQGLLALNTPITEYLPEYRKDTGNQITLAALMANRSGLPGNYRPVVGSIPGALKDNPDATLRSLGLDISIAEGIKKYGSGDLKFTPDSQFDYVNVNWVLVHHILERVTGSSYATVLDEHVFGPAKMKNSGTYVFNLDNNRAATQDIAIGHNPNNPHHDGDYPTPAFVGGGTYTNAGDMIALMHALYSGQLMSLERLGLFSTVTTEEEDYTYGGRVTSYAGQPDQKYSWQSGSNGATNMVTVHKIGDRFSFVAFSNHAHSQGDMFKLSRKIENILAAK